MNETYAQRIRVTFATADTVKYVGHLDMHRAWERAIRRAGLPLAYTQGFNPQARLQFAAALPVGFTGQGEVADVFLNEALDPAEFLSRLAAALPPGIRPLHAEPVARESRRSNRRFAARAIGWRSRQANRTAAFEARLDDFLARAEAWRERRKGKDVARYDLRPLVQELAYVGPSAYGQSFTVVMRAEPGATGRPDELLAELGFEAAPRRIVRAELLFAG